MKDIKIKDATLVSELTGEEKIPVSNGSGKPVAITVNLILKKLLPVEEFDPHRKITAKYFIPEESVNTLVMLMTAGLPYAIEKLHVDGKPINIEEIQLTFGKLTFSESGEHVLEIQTKVGGSGFGPAFQYNTFLTEIDFSNYRFESSNTSNAFASCTNLRTAKFDNAFFTYASNFDYWFNQCNNLQTVSFTNITFGQEDIKLSNMFYGSGITNFDFNKVFKGVDMTKITDTLNMFYQSKLETFKMRNLTFDEFKFQSMFSYCGDLDTIEIINCKFNNVPKALYFCTNCTNLKKIDISGSEFSGDLNNMFNGVSAGGENTIELISNNTKFNNTSMEYFLNGSNISIDFSKVIWNNVNANYIFYNYKYEPFTVKLDGILNYCKSLKGTFNSCTATNVEILNTNFDNIGDSTSLFTNATINGVYLENLKNVDMTTWFNGSKIDSIGIVKCSIKSLYSTFLTSAFSSIDLSNCDLSTCTNMSRAFAGCANLTEVKMTGQIPTDVNVTDMFSTITTTGTFYYDGNYDYSKIIAVLPETWTAVNTSATTELDA